MPELPEVEVVRSILESKVVGKKIVHFECSYHPIIVGNVDDFRKNVEQKRIIRIERYAKYLIFILEDGAFISHLRIEGKYFYLERKDESIKYIHVLLYFEDGTMLAYADMRKFGRIVYKRTEELYSTPPLSVLGVEANAQQYNLQELYDSIHNSSTMIKTILLNQSIISGLGNIYVDEVLFATGILPTKLGKELSKNDIVNIMSSSKRILTKSIELRGTTIRSYTSSLGVKGSYQNFLMVHTKQECSCCGSKITKMKIGGRTTYYCSQCQR